MHWAILAKARVSQKERGLLVVSFESQLGKLLCHPCFSKLEAEYAIAFLPSWQPAYSRELIELAARSSRAFYVLPSSGEDLLSLPKELGANCVTVPLQASSWVSQSAFGASSSRDIDILMLANFAGYKRHWKLFEAIAQMKSRPRVVCAGRPLDGATRLGLERQAEAFGVADSVSVIESPTNNEVAHLLSRARLFCAMSFKEGSFVAVAEALVAGVPVAMFGDASIGTKSLISPETGFLLSSRRPAGPQLDAALAHCDFLRPRVVAIKTFTAEKSLQILNDTVRCAAVERGEAWTRDISAFHSRNFAFGYLNRGDEIELRASYELLERKFGVGFALLASPNPTGA